MRRLILAAFVALTSTVGAQPAVSSSPVTLPPLAPGEVLLEVGATGTSVRPADRARLVVTGSGRAATAAEARAAADAEIRAATQAARAAGIAADDIRPLRPAQPLGLHANSAVEDMALPAEVAAGMVPTVHHAGRTLEIIVRRPADAERVRAAIEQAGVAAVPAPLYEVADEEAALNAAREDALRRARAKAEGFAAAANMRVARLIRISDRAGPESIGWSVVAAMMGVRDGAAGTDVETQVQVEVDFVLAPR